MSDEVLIGVELKYWSRVEEDGLDTEQYRRGGELYL